MNILYIAGSFPKPDQGATIYTDLAQALFEANHNIIIITHEQPKNAHKIELKSERGLPVLRVPVGNYRDIGYIEKGITILKHPFLMKRAVKKYLKNEKLDLILFEAPPVTNARLVAFAKKLFQCPSYLMLKDIFPQNAVDLGIMKRGRLIYKYFHRQEKRLYKTADYIGCMSKENCKYIIKHNPYLDPHKVELFPNTKKISNLQKPQAGLRVERKRLGIPDDACVFLFGGNMGKPQYVDLLCKAIEKCKEDKKVYFLFIGRGTHRAMLQHTIDKLGVKNALVIENIHREQYESIVKECDVGLIILDPSFTIPNYPSRILSYLEYSIPVLAATDKVTDIKELIETSQCGLWAYSGDLEDFLEKIKLFSENLENRIQMGAAGRRYYEQNFDVARSVSILEQHFGGSGLGVVEHHFEDSELQSIVE